MTINHNNELYFTCLTWSITHLQVHVNEAHIIVLENLTKVLL